jgi:hypothetical protein
MREEDHLKINGADYIKVLGWCISPCGFLMLPNNLFFTQIMKESLNYVFCSIIYDCLPTFWQVFDTTLEEIRRFGREEVVEPILELSVVVEGNSEQIVGESGRGGNTMGQGRRVGRMWKNLPVEFPEWPLSSCLQCVVARCHAEESL